MERRNKKEIRDAAGEIKPTCWGCGIAMEKELVSHPVKSYKNERRLDSPFPLMVYYESELCEECNSKMRNI